mmetsp:Transcript_3546/g.14378  ORF Transcript_3546/g.14378 Transcript_3546/m.14378 type:complete len:158 (-) Transcript_3546:45-518(-)|eukprot:PRCOL_00005816-RA
MGTRRPVKWNPLAACMPEPGSESIAGNAGARAGGPGGATDAPPGAESMARVPDDPTVPGEPAPGPRTPEWWRAEALRLEKEREALQIELSRREEVLNDLLAEDRKDGVRLVELEAEVKAMDEELAQLRQRLEQASLAQSRREGAGGWRRWLSGGGAA